VTPDCFVSVAGILAMRIKVVLADGRKMLREGQAVLLEKHPDIKVVGEAAESAAAPKLVRALAADVVVLNTGASARAAAESVKLIAASRAGVTMVVLSLSASPLFVREVLSAGAGGCLTKECASEELASAIRAVFAGRTYLSPRMSDALVAGFLPADRTTARKPLSLREKDILQRIADGHSTKEIAMTLGVSAKTVETHRRRIMEKLNRHTVAELTKYAVSEGLTSLEA
jgi:DNA-binding NarL/FixJ family response regulator